MADAAGREGPVRTNAELRLSRLFQSTWEYVKKSMLTILQAYMMYKPLKTFTYFAVPPIVAGLMIGFLTFMIGLVADVIAANRKLLQDIQYHARRAEYYAVYRQIQKEKADSQAGTKENNC